MDAIAIEIEIYLDVILIGTILAVSRTGMTVANPIGEESGTSTESEGIGTSIGLAEPEGGMSSPIPEIAIEQVR